MKSFVVCIIVAAALSEVTLGQNCETQGPQCDASCNVVLCPEVGADPITVIKCSETPDKKYCQESSPGQFTCSADTCANQSTKHAIKCLGSGQFPSPYSCTTSYICGNVDQPPIAQCECGTQEIYEPSTLSCELALCPDERIPVQCKKIGESETLPGAAEFCYICDENLEANVYKCPKNGGIVIQSHNENIFLSPKAINCSAYQPPGPPPTGVTCTAANQRLPDPADCHKYYICDSSLVPQSRKCSIGFRFDSTRLTCVKGDCVNSLF